MNPNDPIAPGWVPVEDEADRHARGLTKREWMVGQIAMGVAMRTDYRRGASEATEVIIFADEIIKKLGKEND